MILVIRRFWRRSGLIARVGAVLTLSALFLAILASVLAPFGPDQIRDDAGRFLALEAPNSKHLFGTSAFSHDVLSRTLLGFQPALLAVFISIPIGVALGSLFGTLAAFYRGKVDKVAVFISDLLFVFPPLVISMVISLGIFSGRENYLSSVLAAAFSTALGYAAKYFRSVRAEALQVMASGFIEISRATGISPTRIIFSQVLPNSWRVLPTLASRHAVDVVLVLAGLGFLGLGISPEFGGEWGYDLGQASGDVVSGVWWTSLFPGLALIWFVLGFSLMAEWFEEDLQKSRKTEVTND